MSTETPSQTAAASKFSVSRSRQNASAPAVPLLEARDLALSYGGEPILTAISLRLHAGETLSISGTSGSGKTSLLGVLALLVRPDAGHVLIEDRDTAALSDDARSQLRNTFFGFVFQTARLSPALTVLENVLLPVQLGAGTGGISGDTRRRALDLLHELNLDTRTKHRPHELSQGQRRRVALARAVIRDPRLLLADEPTNDLDPDNAARVADFLFAQAALGRALLLVTHDPHLAARAHRQAHLANGLLHEQTQIS
jgi:ABC-type lipoprotein export system ATPase subunit